METTTSALMTEQQFISMFKEKGFELYKTEELKKQIQDRDKTTDEQSLRLINLFDASLSENQPVISEEEIKKIFPDEATMIGRAKFAETTPEETDANLRGQKWMKMFIEDMIEHLSLSSNDKQEKKQLSEISDEDAEYFLKNTERFGGLKELRNIRFSKPNLIRFEFKDPQNGWLYASVSIDGQTPAIAYQYLQFKGYELPVYYPEKKGGENESK